MEDQLSILIQKAQISHLLTNYFGAIDDKKLDKTTVETTFTEDAKILRPNGSVTTGHDNILDGHRKSFARFKATHHVITDYIIDIYDHTATLRANLTAMHLWAGDDENSPLHNKHFLAGAVLTAQAIKIGTNWRISELVNRNVWRTGDGMAEMANYERPEG
ncbi:nuclear transport factor 2 family protein [Siphonobacter sp. SORGH_AS_0500]|uniref:nuclear transport factor 2 family protein n=1 Tax=Siphonobacter sp. SORGH_AS_0500 TaxID=1864824 RepID=UPI00285A5E3E|nr:nuclear transport factor 2 family protein [Siphonobacter sp. SORGH_AS_0500]MDR6193273.1 hypothetical protein [Siphonobacter sp. SORGH_AS_0500]